MGNEQTSPSQPTTTVGNDPKDTIRAWKRTIRRSQRDIDKQIRGIDGAVLKTKKEVEECLKRGDQTNAKTLAKEIVTSKKAMERLYTASAHLDSITSELEHQYALIRTTKAMQSAGDILKHMNACCKLPELQSTMQELSREMMKAGIVEEMVNETMDDMDEDLDEEADAEVEKVVESILDGSFDKAPTKSLVSPGSETSEEDPLEKRLAAVRASG
ncbi:Vacuolar protein sorting 24B (Vps24B) [Monocercomonoides exilis]|uniref:Vacuolar protein sorting 24B (Vps24B) n=1 Tax=Monocercomonoides exilis TaxID=2049356 RepID=UPI003559ACFA|nr:Vacuolar protein sorting 24B (Vps24B) [Monocercomonoides exilis]|eukprot:MONOS_11038.1-p1 / transcript=MONOS_11038.1 / gene=MONOS_11038 / organism=Monocercomonoides_exilis_PA203 / gene_product= Vacuolar protein sorting 24B (Vps24B) / transcript_product= Vacuolar protein sorting 24B (Vps24B) / location=Mono_scaffold00530:26019-26849(-) / protein_length=215 / sequence_SO=supercontig / SO=protein_coding / is_pseudo=false